MAEFIIAKQRNGPTDTVKLEFEGRFAQFSDWSMPDDPYSSAPGGGSFTGPSHSSFGDSGGFGEDDPF